MAKLLLDSFDFTVHRHHPKDFLILFSSLSTKEQLAGGHFIHSPRFSLSMRSWCKLAHVRSSEFGFHVELELHGVPAQA